jgi:hypothetical protein
VDVVSEALAGVGEQVAVLSKVCDELSHRELIQLLVELTTVLRSIPAVEHRILSRLTDETEPGALGEASWKKVLTTGLRCSERAGHPQRVAGDGDRVDDVAGVGEWCRGRGHRGWLVVADAGSDPAGRQRFSLSVRV